jgi:hypothetical protein
LLLERAARQVSTKPSSPPSIWLRWPVLPRDPAANALKALLEQLGLRDRKRGN